MKQFLMHTNYLNKRKKKYLKNGEFVTPLHCACKEHEKKHSPIGYCMVLHGTAWNRKSCEKKEKKGRPLTDSLQMFTKGFLLLKNIGT